jgi:hypothetical protein
MNKPTGLVSAAKAPLGITLGYTAFRPETIPFAQQAMQGHDLVILEEPQTPRFEAMLAGEFAIKEYLLHTEFEFPACAAVQCRLLRGNTSKGFP